MISKNVRRFFFIVFITFQPSFVHSQLISSTVSEFPLIISEIMADPLPPVNLPVHEYIELLNRSSSDWDISGWTLQVGIHVISLPEIILNAGEYYTVCDDEAADTFEVSGNIIPVVSMPPILNSGQVITLRNANGKVMHSVQFTDGWYKSAHKSDGGWSLEMVDPDNPCTGYENWEASRDKNGGTPGGVNSVAAFNPDQEPPRYLRATMPSDTSIELFFSESLDHSAAASCGNFSINNGLFHPELAVPVEPGFTSIILQYKVPFKPGFIYTIAISDSLSDCRGNLLNNSFGNFGVPAMPGIYDIVINEIMFEPATDMAEYIEIYNRTERIIDLSSLYITLNDNTGNSIMRISFEEDPWQLLPRNYYVITRNAAMMPDKCLKESTERIIENRSFFRLPDEEGYLAITDTLLNVIDEVHYSRFMHSELLHDTRGVALERTDSEPPSTAEGKWRSASSKSGYSTPGYPNSQLISGEHENDFVVYPETISPDDDGNNDYAVIVCSPGEPGWAGNITVFSIEGRLIRSLAENALLGTEEIFIWDGTTNDGQHAEIGIYIVFGEIFNNRGRIKKYKKVVSLIRK